MEAKYQDLVENGFVPVGDANGEMPEKMERKILDGEEIRMWVLMEKLDGDNYGVHGARGRNLEAYTIHRAQDRKVMNQFKDIGSFVDFLNQPSPQPSIS